MRKARRTMLYSTPKGNNSSSRSQRNTKHSNTWFIHRFGSLLPRFLGQGRSPVSSNPQPSLKLSRRLTIQTGQGEYEQHPLRQQTSMLPVSHVGGAQFVLKPPRVPKPRVSRAQRAAINASKTRPLGQGPTPQPGPMEGGGGMGGTEGLLGMTMAPNMSMTMDVHSMSVEGSPPPSGHMHTTLPPDPAGSETNTFAAPARPSRKLKRYPCDICGQIFTRSGDVRRHKDSRHTDGTGGCRCPYCDRVLTRLVSSMFAARLSTQ